MKTLAQAGDAAEIRQRLHALRADSARRWGRMSAHQAVCHLTDSLRTVMGRKDVSPATSVFHRTVVKWVALYLPFRWPPGIQTRPEVDQDHGGTRPATFAADVADLEALLDLVTAASRSFEWHPHPIFGRMSEREWMRWGYLHMDHHLRQFGV